MTTFEQGCICTNDKVPLPPYIALQYARRCVPIDPDRVFEDTRRNYWVNIRRPSVRIIQAAARPKLRKRMVELENFANASDYAQYFQRDHRGWAQFIRSEKIRAD